MAEDIDIIRVKLPDYLTEEERAIARSCAIGALDTAIGKMGVTVELVPDTDDSRWYEGWSQQLAGAARLIVSLIEEFDADQWDARGLHREALYDMKAVLSGSKPRGWRSRPLGSGSTTAAPGESRTPPCSCKGHRNSFVRNVNCPIHGYPPTRPATLVGHTPEGREVRAWPATGKREG